MKQYFSNTRHNKAAMILASYSPDVVEDIVALVQARGYGLVQDLNASDGPPRPNAILSRRFISDSDFPHVYIGLLTLQLANLRMVSPDNDFYQTVLESAFGIPKVMSEALSKKIETYDILGGMAENDKRAWSEKLGDSLQEAIRQSVNWAPSVLQIAWENDQRQDYDVDRLYEFKILGEVVEDLSSRARLMTAQAAVSQATGLFRVKGMGTVEGGDIEDGDPDVAADALIGQTMRPLMGAPLPPSLYGGTAGIALVGRASSSAQAQRLIEHGGYSRNPGKAGVAANPVLKNALSKILNAKPGKIAALAAMAGAAPFLIKTVAGLVKQNKAAKVMGDVVADIADTYGDTVASHYAMGDVEGLYRSMTDLAGDIETTGDPQLDEAIAGDVMEHAHETGDPDADAPEQGGLFKRMRINSAIRQGNRRMRRNKKKAAKIMRKNAESDALLQSQQFRGQQNLANTMDQMNTEQSSEGAEDYGNYDEEAEAYPQ